MDAAALVRTFFETFDAEAKAEFAAFVARQPAGANWLIAADYVVDDKKRPVDVFAFTIIPDTQGLPALQDRIRRVLHRDIKETRELDPSGLALLKAPDVFHFAIMLSKKRMLFAETGDESVLIARKTAEELLSLAKRQDRGERAITALQKVRDFAASKRFSHRLMADVLLLSLLFPAITIALMRETNSRDIAWMSDRDRMTTWCGGALWPLAHISLRAMTETMGVEPGAAGPGVCVPSENKMWFDDMVRLPDYLAGTLATWDADVQDYASESKIEMVSDIYRQVIAEAENLAVLRLQADKSGTGWTRMVFQQR